MSYPTPDQEAAQGRIHDLLAELVDLIGPRFDGTDEDAEPAGQVFLGEWVAVMSWTDETGDSYLTRIGSASLLSHHRDGLLHQGLYGFD